MNIRITIKQLGKKRDKIADAKFLLEKRPATVRELIEEAVHTCVSEYNRNVKEGEEKPLFEEQIENMSEIGKIAFGINYGEKQADEEKAKEILLEKEIIINVALNSGDISSTAWGCDLTYEYVKINGDYRT